MVAEGEASGSAMVTGTALCRLSVVVFTEGVA